MSFPNVPNRTVIYFSMYFRRETANLKIRLFSMTLDALKCNFRFFFDENKTVILNECKSDIIKI